MKKNDDTVSLTPGELADVIQAYMERIEDLRDRISVSGANIHDTSAFQLLTLTGKLKALLFDVRKELVHALRLVDAEEEIKAP